MVSADLAASRVNCCTARQSELRRRVTLIMSVWSDLSLSSVSLRSAFAALTWPEEPVRSWRSSSRLPDSSCSTCSFSEASLGLSGQSPTLQRGAVGDLRPDGDA